MKTKILLLVFCICLLIAQCKTKREATLTTATTAVATDSIKDKQKADSILAADSLRIRLEVYSHCPV